MNMAEDPFEDTRHFILAGTTLAYREKGGDGTPVVFVHGGLSDLRTWDKQLEAISASHRTISYSRRYARPNEEIPAGADDQMLPHVDDLAAILQGLDTGPATLVGNSWGAFICLLTAIRHPGLMAKLVLEDPPSCPCTSAHLRDRQNSSGSPANPGLLPASSVSEPGSPGCRKLSATTGTRKPCASSSTESSVKKASMASRRPANNR